MLNLSPEDFQRYLRIVIQWFSGALVSYGIARPDSTWLPILTGGLMFAGSAAWTVYGNRIQAKINEVAALKQADGRELVEHMKVNDVAVANAAPANVTATPTAKL